MKQLTHHWWLVAAVCIAALFLFQQNAARDIDRRTAELHALLADTQTQVLHLTRQIGYGGLIHNFKNLVLRADEPDHYDKAYLSAARADMLIDDLEATAARLDVDLTLASTRTMIAAYRSRLDDILILNGEGMGPTSIDDAVRFDDGFAIREIDDLLEKLTTSVTNQVEGLAKEALVYRSISMVGTLIICGLTLGLLLHQSYKRRHLDTVRQMNEQLAISNASLSSANGALQQFAGIASHDLRTPLRHIGVFADMIDEDIAEPDEVRAHLAEINGAVERMNRMMASLLEFTRAGFKTPELAPIDIRELVESVVTDLGPTIDAANAQVTLDLHGHMLGDRELLRRVLQNLIGNSLKYVHRDRTPHLEVVSKYDGGQVELSFSDNGIGIDPQFAERIFEPCERLHANQSEYAGSGIGLALVRAVVEAHGGTVRLDTDFTDGTRFIVRLDKAEPAVLLRAA